MGSVTIKDVAARACVSVSTVNKALYGKSGVSEEKRQQIAALAEQMGYRPSRAAQSLAQSRIRIGVVLPKDWPVYHEAIKAGIFRALETLHDFFISGEVSYFDPHEDADAHVQTCFAGLASKGCQAVIFAPGERHSYEGALAWADSQGIPVALAGDARPGAKRLFSVETDVSACAHLAADFLHLITPPDSVLAVVNGWSDFEPHRLKAEIFRKAVGRNVLAMEAFDNDEIAYRKTKALLEEVPTLGGIYVATSVCGGVLQAVRECGRKIPLITTDLNEHTKKDLQDDLIHGVIYQNTCLQGAIAVLALADYLTLRQQPPERRLIAPKLYLKDACPSNPLEALDELVVRG